MRIILVILLFFGSVNFIGAQKLSLRLNWTLLQVNQIETSGRINLDSTSSATAHHYLDKFRQRDEVSVDYPGLSLEFRFANNLFLNSEMKFTINKFKTESATEYVERLSPTYNLQRYFISLEGGYYFRRSKLLKPFISFGISFTKMYARFDEDYYTEANAYLTYINATPVFLSAFAKTGLKYGPFGFGLSFSQSITPISSDGKLKYFRNVTLFNLMIDFARSGVIRKPQYKSSLETDDLKITRSQVLKQSELSWNIGMPYMRLVNVPYLMAWRDGNVNYRIDASRFPRSSWVPYLNINSVNSINTKRTVYFQSNVGFQHMRYTYEDAKTITSGSYSPLTPGDDPLISNTYDIKMNYNLFWLGLGNGFKIKTTRRSFIYGDFDIRVNIAGRNGKDKDTEWDIPPLKKMFLSSSIEGGLKMNHLGFALSLERNISKLDLNQFYDHWYNLSLKFIYDVSSR